MGIGEQNAAIGEAIEMRSLRRELRIEPESVVVEIIDGDEQDIRSLTIGPSDAGEQNETDDEEPARQGATSAVESTYS